MKSGSNNTNDKNKPPSNTNNASNTQSGKGVVTTNSKTPVGGANNAKVAAQPLNKNLKNGKNQPVIVEEEIKPPPPKESIIPHLTNRKYRKIHLRYNIQ